MKSSGVCALAWVIVAACACELGKAAAPALATPTLVLHQWPDMPLWAYGVTAVPQAGDQAKPQGPPGRSFDPAIDHDEQLKPLHVEGSSRTYTPVDLSDWQNEVDWFPNEHKPMPVVVEHGPASLGAQTRACAVCHKTNGGGRPENAAIAGLSVAYFVRQLGDFRAGRRASSDPRKPNVPTMVALVRAMSDGEEHAAAEYYAAQSGGPRLQVIETERAPSTHLDGNLYVASGSERTEPLHERILEVAQDSRQSEELDNPHFGYIAYVPTGSIARGQGLARGGGGTAACSSCHGEGLRGLGDAPPIAGRSPSYLVRQLYDFKTGARDGVQAVLMKPLVARLTATQMTDIAAYIATLPRADAARH